MSLFITKQTDINAYYESDRLNQSSLKELQFGLDKFLAKQKFKKESKYFIIGSAVDVILTGEEGEFDNQFIVFEGKVPSEKPELIAKTVLQKYQVFYSDSIPENIHIDSDLDLLGKTIREHEYYNNRKIESLVEDISKTCYHYFEFLKNSIGKTILDISDKEVIDNVVKSLRDNPTTSYLFDRDDLQSCNSRDVYYQLPIYFIYMGVECKALLDILIVNKIGDEIVSFEVIDLKTMAGYTADFEQSFKKFGYDIQGVFYQMAAEYYMYDVHNFAVDLGQVKRPKFVVESKEYIGKPMVYEMTPKTMNLAFNGHTEIQVADIVVKKEKLGIISLFELYKYYENTMWQEDFKFKNGYYI
jgi:hypothetical protein